MGKFDRRKVAAINSLEVVDYSIAGDECEFVAVADTAENRQALLAAGFTSEELDCEEVRDGFDGRFDVAYLAFQHAGAGWYSVGQGFSERRVDAMPTDAQAKVLLNVYDYEYLHEGGVNARSAAICERNGWLRRVTVDTGLMRFSGPIIERYWQATEDGVAALRRYSEGGDGGDEDFLRPIVRKTLQARAGD